MDFYRAACDARGGESGFGPGSCVEVDVVGILVGDAGRDGGFPEAVLDQQRGAHSGGFPFAVGVAGGNGADNRADLAGEDQPAFDPQSRADTLGAQGHVGVEVAANI